MSTELTPPERRYDDLGAAIRALSDAATKTGLDDDELRAVTTILEDTTRRLSASTRHDEPTSPFHPMSLVGGTANPVAPQVRLDRDGAGVSGTVTLGARFEGAPTLSHGGIVALLFDHAMGVAMYLNGHAAMTRNLNVQYRAPTPLYQPLRVYAEVKGVEGRNVSVVGEITCDGRTTATADAVFIELTAENVQRVFANRFANAVHPTEAARRVRP